jgi:hypothetical protein
MAAHLTPAEAASASAVLDDCCDKLAFLATISPDVNEHRMEESNRIGDEMSRIIAEQRKLEGKFEQLIAQRSQLKTSSNKTKTQENQDEIREVSKQLKMTTKLLCRVLKDNPNVAENLMKLQGDRRQLESLLRLAIEELRDAHFTTLDERVTEEQADYEQLENKKRREQEATLAVKTLGEQLEQEQNLHASEVTEHNAVISKLKDQLHELRSTSSFSTKLLQKEYAAQIECQVRQYTKQERDLEDEIAALNRETERETRVNAEIVKFLTKTKEELGDKLTHWEAKSEADQKALAEAVEEIDEQHAQDVIRKNEMEEHKSEAEAEKAARLAEEQRVREELEAARLEKEQHDYYATKLQVRAGAQRCVDPYCIPLCKH